ncbi:MAG: hypothetical protein NTV98_04190 [Candidatus Roizmanbacteria bacterium]|nr:hypothetical protein [Candidatus Roizmanbacteria bacterium]
MDTHTIKWLTKINWGKVFIVGIIYTVVATLIHQLEAMISLKYYMMPEYFAVWSRTMMPIAGPPPMDFFVKSTIMTITSGISLALVYCYIRDMLPKNIKERVLLFADLLAGLQFIFFILPVYLLFNLPIGLLINWFISGFLILVITSYLCVKILK